MQNHHQCIGYENVPSKTLNREKHIKLNRRIQERVRKLYGYPLPIGISRRLSEEYAALEIGDMNHVFYTLMKAIDAYKQERKPAYCIKHRSGINASFIAWLLGITNINPLPVHYHCPKCSYTDFGVPESYHVGIDLPNRKCPICGENLHKDGFNIPSIIFFGDDSKRNRELSISVSDPELMIECLCSVISPQCRCLDSFGYAFDAEQLAGYMASDTKHLIYTSEGDEIKNYTDTFTYRGHSISVERGWDIDGPIHIIHISKDPTCNRVEQLTAETGVAPNAIPLHDSKIVEHLISRIRNGPCKGFGDFEPTSRAIAPDCEPYRFNELFERCDIETVDDLMRVSSLVHGTGTMEVAINQLDQGIQFRSIPADREDVLEILHQFVSYEDAYRLSEPVCKGRGKFLKQNNILDTYAIPDYLIDGRIRYMYTRTATSERVLLVLKLAYYAVFLPEEYKSAICSVKRFL